MHIRQSWGGISAQRLWFRLHSVQLAGTRDRKVNVMETKEDPIGGEVQ